MHDHPQHTSSRPAPRPGDALAQRLASFTKDDAACEAVEDLSKARSTGYEPNVCPDESENQLMLIVDGDDEDLMGTESSQLGQTPPPCKS